MTDWREWHRAYDDSGSSLSRRRAWRWELARYDEFLVLAPDMLEIAVPEHAGDSLVPESRAVLEDRLSQAGLDVWAPRVVREGGCY